VDVHVKACTLTGSILSSDDSGGCGIYLSGAENIFIDDCDFGANVSAG
jgi:hypothetical protein